jgi:hypothetical protein
VREVLNDAILIYSADATLASAFVGRWRVGSKVETAGGVYRVREGEPAAPMHLVRGPSSDAFAFLFAD